MKVEIRPFSASGRHKEIWITNEAGYTLALSSIGARINRWLTPDGQNLILGYETAEDLLAEPNLYYGATIGRVAGRIAQSQFRLDGTTYHLPANEGAHHLHGGPSALDQAVWDACIKHHGDSVSVDFSYQESAGVRGYPGTIDIRVTHTFDEENRWTVNYWAQTTDEATILDPTNHVYFNLNGDMSQSILNHHVQINADHVLALDTENIPTGQRLAVEETAFDLRDGQCLRELFEPMPAKLERTDGLDHPFVLNSSAEPVAVVTCPETDYRIEMTTDAPCVVVYTHNTAEPDKTIFNQSPLKYAGITLETQCEPNAANEKNFSDITLRVGDIYSRTTSYQLVKER